MADDDPTKRIIERQEIIERLEKDYVPDRNMSQEDARRSALNFMAFRIGRIDDKLNKIQRSMAWIAQKTSPT